MKKYYLWCEGRFMKKIFLTVLFCLFNLNLSCSDLVDKYIPLPVIAVDVSQLSRVTLERERKKCKRTEFCLSTFCNRNIIGMIAVPAVIYGISQNNVGIAVGSFVGLFVVNFVVDLEKRDNRYIHRIIQNELKSARREQEVP